jgi:hypothetical protein
MSPNIQTVHRRPAKGAYYMVALYHDNWADPDPVLYTTNSSSLNEAPGNWKSVPDMKVVVGKRSGLMKEKSTTITLQQDEFLSRLSSGEPHQRMFCRIIERSVSIEGSTGDLESALTVFTGQLTRTFKNHRRKLGSTHLVLENWKSRLDIPVNQGIVEPNCVQPFLGGKCALGLNIVDFRQTANIIGIDGKVITITDPGVTNKAGFWWRRGTIKVFNKEIVIDDWSEVLPETFYMVEDIPSDWQGESSELLPGCDKEYLSGCTLHENTDNFSGFGYAVPAYLPVIETGKSG